MKSISLREYTEKNDRRRHPHAEIASPGFRNAVGHPGLKRFSAPCPPVLLYMFFFVPFSPLCCLSSHFRRVVTCLSEVGEGFYPRLRSVLIMS